jgi:ribosomal protein S27AE
MPGLEIEMNSNNNDARDRKIKQDTRAWAELTGTKYTTALRQTESQLTQGFLGERVSARHLINILDDHPLIGADGGEWVLGEAGFYADKQWSFNGTSDFVELALLTDFLRMFTPVAPGETPAVDSYSLKHTAENFLKPHCSYVTNGRLIWAAAALGLPLVEQRDGGPNLLIGVSEREHDYVRRMVTGNNNAPRGHQHRPAGLTHLQTALEQCAAGGPVPDRWERPEPSTETFPFHEWLMLQADRDDVVGDLAGDYFAGVQGSDHRIAATAQELLDILGELSASSGAFESAVEAITEWARIAPPELRGDVSIRTEQVTSNEEDAPGWGAGAGTIERHEYLCPCGRGFIVEEHDNIPGFREHDVRIACGKCSQTWRIVPGTSVRNWRVEPKPADAAA